MSKFIKRLLIFSSPLVLLILSYFIFDPFHVLRSYDFYGSNYLKSFNRNRIGTDTYLRNKDQYQYASFILGSSRSSAFRTTDWAALIADPHPYHFDAFNDNVSGMRMKLEFIEKQGSAIKNVLLVLDPDSFSEQFDKEESIVHLKDYRWNTQFEHGPKNFFSYHLTFFKAFFKKQYFIHFLDLKLNKKYRPHMADFFKFKYFYKAPSNDFYFPENEESIKKDSVAYYLSDDFKNRLQNPPAYDLMIKENHVEDLKTMAKILERNKTRYKVIFSPMYEQRLLNPVDVQILEDVFGKENFYNYAGKNRYTNFIGNYYERSHYKPHVGKAILEEIYR
jgi:hypothetical protein